MATKKDLDVWVKEALIELGGRGRIVPIASIIWKNHEKDLRNSGNLFYTWQYDMRWSAKRLRTAKIMKSAEISPSGVWELV